MPTTSTDRIKGHGPIQPHRFVLHTTEGVMNAHDLAPFFRTVEADVHLAIDKRGDAVHIVADDEKAWHVAAYNPSSLGIEQCGFARWNERDWVVGFNLGLLRVAAALSNWKATHRTIDLDHKVNGGVCYHRDLGGLGGGHSDPGVNYPMRYVLYLARLHWYRHHETPSRAAKVRMEAYKAYCHRIQHRHGLPDRTSL